MGLHMNIFVIRLLGLLLVALLTSSAHATTTGNTTLAAQSAFQNRALAQSPASDPSAIVGRWNLRFPDARDISSSWLEVERSGYRALVGRFVGFIGGARPIGKIEWSVGVARFTIPTEWEGPVGDLRFEIRPSGDSLIGTMFTSNGTERAFVGKRAPLLLRKMPLAWTRPVALFNGRDLSGWTPAPTARSLPSRWLVRDGILVNSGNEGANLMTTRRFEDFQLHVEFRYPRGNDSGILLRGRYEVQIRDNPDRGFPDKSMTGAVYGFLIPSENAALGPDAWQTMDITLVGRRVTVVVNGKLVIVNQIIPGLTGSAIDSNEGEPGPIVLQGEENRVEFRSITLSEPVPKTAGA